ncbi:hypothetical protein N7466_000935 [Penicillium verhagenii]|uniref:uncharacterized protein n=1 Tax=Penicillium verhagenii TaxID=1562060 RepID=UPI0025451E5E|nr:uncharacterized protein N7466_000935 [Penicillium verhagenii]KAJ5947920.1 hypothetical protein N7466_000935 [Penicillium verhagenii]
MYSHKAFHVRPLDYRTQEKLWEESEKKTMATALEEALGCRKCPLSVTEASMKADIDQGKYITTNYPPFFTNANTRDENISPLDTTTPNKHLSHWKVISDTQRQLYYKTVEHTLDSQLHEEEATDPELAILFAHYKVDFHIRQHYLAHRGVLTLCRDATDMQSLRKWQWRMDKIDKLSPSEEEEVKQVRHKMPRPLGWPKDESLELMHQTHLWKKSWKSRQKRVEDVRARWAIIMEERRRQRERLLAMQASKLTVRLYFGGELRDLRELERKVYPGMGMLMGRSTQSFGV